MVTPITKPFDSEGTFIITLASLADAAGRCSDAEANASDYPAAKITIKLTSDGASAPDDMSVCTVYLLLDPGTIASDGWAGSDAAFTPLNSFILGTLLFTDDANTAFYGVFDTEKFGAIGPSFGIAIVNDSGQALHSTGGNHLCHYKLYYPEIQD